MTRHALVEDKPTSPAEFSAGTVEFREGILASLIVFVILAAEVMLSRPDVLLGHDFGYDELITRLIVTDPSLSHSLRALVGGVDTNPPTYFLLLRGFCVLIDATDATALRTFSLICTGIGFVFIYFVLRRTFSVWVCFLAVAAMWPNMLLFSHVFDARYYGVLLAAAAVFCFFYCNDHDGALWKISAGVSAVLLCTLHYFGIISWGAIVLGDFLARRGSVRQRLVHVLPALAGPVALAACLPFLRGQSSGLSTRTWIKPLTTSQAINSVKSALDTTVLPAMTALWLICDAIRQRRPGTGKKFVPAPVGPVAPVLGMGMLVILPLILIAFSFLVQPAWIGRYMLNSVLGVTVLVALVSSRSPAVVLAPVTAICLLIGAGYLHLFSRVTDQSQIAQQQWVHRFSDPNDTLPIVCFSGLEGLVMYYYAPEVRPRVFILNVDTCPAKNLPYVAHYLHEFDARVSRFYNSMPATITWDQLRNLGRFHLVNPESIETSDYGVVTKSAEISPALAEGFGFSRVAYTVYEVAQ
jgi:hypothetical protein